MLDLIFIILLPKLILTFKFYKINLNIKSQDHLQPCACPILLN